MKENEDMALTDLVCHDPRYRTKKPIYHYEANGLVEDPDNDLELKACSKCLQMTHHIKGECLKCKAKKQ